MSSFLLRRCVPSHAARTFSTSASRSTFAKITIVGRLVDQPELTATSSGQDILKYAVAADSGRGENKKTSFFRVASFLPDGPQRGFIQNLEKGTLVYVEGEPSIAQYTDSEGNNRTALNIVQHKLEALSPKRQTDQTQ